MMFSRFLTFLFSWWARKEAQQQAERQRFDRIMRASEKPYTAPEARLYNITAIPRAAGNSTDRKRVG